MPYLNGIIGDASNLSFGSNPPYAIEDFLQVYPQFGNDANNNSVIPTAIIQMYINLATTCIKKDKWFDAWEVAMGWFIAHFLTLYLQGTADPNSGAAGVLQAGQTRGLDTSVSAGGVSVSTDYGTITQDLNGWAGWKLTIYGTQLASMARIIGIGGSYAY
ncbi:DUF4054 domain-containing protein [Clostridium sp. BJN0013]|jgi:hypothetical protein|uniref:DUF4054 domain-containing protein n=1 Tax=Clostridium sp. BJN0013 TaxID=3236840 RepID=UPI0034C69477